MRHEQSGAPDSGIRDLACSHTELQDRRGPQAQGSSYGLNRDDLKNLLTFLGLFPKDTAYHTAFARFLVTEGRRQYFWTSLRAQWQPVQKTACRQQALRDRQA